MIHKLAFAFVSTKAIFCWFTGRILILLWIWILDPLKSWVPGHCPGFTAHWYGLVVCTKIHQVDHIIGLNKRFGPCPYGGSKRLGRIDHRLIWCTMLSESYMCFFVQIFSPRWIIWVNRNQIQNEQSNRVQNHPLNLWCYLVSIEADRDACSNKRQMEKYLRTIC